MREKARAMSPQGWLARPCPGPYRPSGCPRPPPSASAFNRRYPSTPASDRRSGTSRSGASVSSRAERPCRRTQTVAQPSRRAVGTSEAPSATCAIASGATPRRRIGLLEDRRARLVGADLLGGHDVVEVHAELPGGGGEQVVVDVRDDREPVAALEGAQRPDRVGEGPPRRERGRQHVPLGGPDREAEPPPEALDHAGEHRRGRAGRAARTARPRCPGRPGRSRRRRARPRAWPARGAGPRSLPPPSRSACRSSRR